MVIRSGGVIALDADGVLLDYAAAYQAAWERAFGVLPALKNPDAFWPWDRWDVPRLSHTELQPLRDVMDETFWTGIPSMEGAVQACESLIKAGHRLVCVTALNPKWAEARKANLERIGFGLADLVVADNTKGDSNPKAPLINAMRPQVFVDDYLPYMLGIQSDVHKALVVRDAWGSPNTGPDMEKVNSTHGNLEEFAKWWLSRTDGQTDG